MKTRAALTLILVAAAAVVAVAVWALVSSFAAHDNVQAAAPTGTSSNDPGVVAPQTASASGEPATSTPVDQWQAGSMPHLYQTDPAWSSEPYAGGTVGENGCGPTALTMAYVYLTGKTDFDPASMCAFSERNGFVDQGMTAWLFMTEGAGMLGLTSEELPAAASTVADVLASGMPVICSMGPGDFTTTGHFIVLCGLDEQGRARVFDPNSEQRSSQTWDIDTVLRQCRNLWALSAS